MPSPTLTRRALIAGAGTAVASAALAVPYVAAAHPEELCTVQVEPVADPLLDAIHAYRRGLADFNLNANGEDSNAFDAYADVTFRPPMEAMEAWEGPAHSFSAAVEALRVAYEEIRDCGDTDFVINMLAAAVGFFDTTAA